MLHKFFEHARILLAERWLTAAYGKTGRNSPTIYHGGADYEITSENQLLRLCCTLLHKVSVKHFEGVMPDDPDELQDYNNNPPMET